MFLSPRDGRRVVDLPISGIVAGPSHPSAPGGEGREEDLRALADSIATYGMIVPLIVRPSGKRGQYELVAGRRRLEACRRLGWTRIPAVIRHYDDQQALVAGLLENSERSHLRAVEEAEAFSHLWQAFVRPVREALARKMGLDPEELRLREALLHLSMIAREAVVTGLITTEHALALLPLRREEEQIQALTRIHREDLSVAATREMVSALLEAREPRHPAATAPWPPGAEPWDSERVARLSGLQAALGRGESPLGALQGLARGLLEAFRTHAPGDFLDFSHRRPAEPVLVRHAWNVAKLSVFLGDHLGFDDGEMEKLALSALLYDVGMLEIPPVLLAKPGGLGEGELALIRRHPLDGNAMLKRLPGLDPVVARVALEHHERGDGSGYPRRLRGGKTHPFSRLVAVADCFEAACAPRAYRPPASPRTVMQAVILQAERGILDRDMVRAFLQALSLYPVGSLVRLGSGELARVMRAVPVDVTRPVVRVLRGADGKPSEPREIDLSLRPDLTVSDAPAEWRAAAAV